MRAINKSTITCEDLSHAFLAFGIRISPGAPPSDFDGLVKLSGQDFERLISTLLTRMGFHAEMTKTTGDGGIDIIATLDRSIIGGRYLFQCKRFAPDNLVGSPTVRDFYGAVTADRAVRESSSQRLATQNQAREFAERVGSS